MTPITDSFVISIEGRGCRELMASTAEVIRKRAADLDATLAELS